MYRLHSFLILSFNAEIVNSLDIQEDHQIKWHGIGGRTVSQTKRYDVDVKSFAPMWSSSSWAPAMYLLFLRLKLAPKLRTSLPCCLSPAALS